MARYLKSRAWGYEMQGDTNMNKLPRGRALSAELRSRAARALSFMLKARRGIKFVQLTTHQRVQVAHDTFGNIPYLDCVRIL